MIKIMLVEDDKSLREIYGVRLLAEGYDIVSAGDGEEALAMAIKERPRLIISDVMMPKISGFDMLDILRSTTETKNIKVIMMTALSSEEQRERGEALGADRYLVKSQVGIEDVVRVVHEVLEDRETATTPPPPPSANRPTSVPPRPASAPVPVQAPAQMPQPQVPMPTVTAQSPAPTSVIPTPASNSTQPPPNLSRKMVSQPSSLTNSSEPDLTSDAAAAAQPSVTPKPASLKTRVIEPLNDPTTQPVDIGELLDKELAKEAGIAPGDIPTIVTTSQEKNLVNEQLSQFVPPPPPPAPSVPGTIPVEPTTEATTPSPETTTTTNNALSGTTLEVSPQNSTDNPTVPPPSSAV